MSGNELMDKDSSWMAKATEDELRGFVKILDSNENHPRHKILVKEFDKECNRRASIDNEQRAGGEWI